MLSVQVPIFVSSVYERWTCLRRESISSSFCLISVIWARMYSHLLKCENEHSSSLGEEVEGEGTWETTQSSILQEVKKVKGQFGREGEGAKQTVAWVQETSHKNGCHLKGNHLLWCTSRFQAFNNTLVLPQPAALAHVLTKREIAFHLMSTQARLRVFGGFELA